MKSISELKKIILLPVAIIACMLFINNNVQADDIVRGVFPKEQSIVNYGLELMDMDDSKAFEIYMELLSVNTETKEIKIEFETPIILDSKNQSELTTVDKEKFERIGHDAQIAIDAFIADYPEIFWFDIGNSKSSASIEITTQPDGTQSFLIKGMKIILEVYPEYSENANAAYDGVVSELNKILEASKDMNRYDKLKYFHDYLIETVEYEKDTEDDFNMQGALVNKTAACEGYAESFKALCDLSGIPCVIVRGNSINFEGNDESHMWNYCLMEDDKWYAVDVTWDDVGITSYDYFLVGSNTLIQKDNMTFSQNHISVGDFSLTGIHEFTYPNINGTAFGYTEVKYGDLTGDGIVNSSDALEILKLSAKIRIPDEEELKLGDVDGNGILDASDALYVLKLVAKLIDKLPIEM